MKTHLHSRYGKILGVILAGFCLHTWAHPAAPATQEFQFQGTYESLSAPQKALIDDFLARFRKVIGKPVDASELYRNSPISSRTTFEAVTHALSHSRRTDAQGASLGTALDLVARLDAVKGQVPKSRGDLQFRIYAQLVPEAMDILNRCQEFHRGADNTVYHKGYPVCYRQAGGAPSIQLSLAADGKRADIDVDYRSSKFPSALFNGHLSSSNSDVRAGNNVDRHNNRWTGLSGWWRNLFGLPTTVGVDEKQVKTSEGLIPKTPRAGKGKIDAAVTDFLTAWLLEQRPEQAMAYISPRTFQCLQPEDPDQPPDLGMAPFRVLKSMAEVNQSLGTLKSLRGVLASVPLTNPVLRPVQHATPDLFKLYSLPDHAGESIRCEGGQLLTDVPPAPAKPAYGKYYIASFHLDAGDIPGAALYLLWAKESKYWKIFAFKLEPDEAPRADLPDLRPAEPAEAAPVPVAGDPLMIESATAFFTTWLIHRETGRCPEFMSPRLYPCLDLYRPEGAPLADSPENAARRVREGLAKAADQLGPVTNLADALRPIEQAADNLLFVSHPQMKAFSVLSVPDHIGDACNCDRKPEKGQRPPVPAQGPQYGRYYATAFQLRGEGGEAATAFFLWSQEDGQWKISWMYIDTP